jgi:hypothetical protein
MGGKLRAPGLTGRGTACTSWHSINARSPSLASPRPPWHGRGQGFESPKFHGKSASPSAFDLERRMIVLCDRGAIWS